MNFLGKDKNMKKFLCGFFGVILCFSIVCPVYAAKDIGNIEGTLTPKLLKAGSVVDSKGQILAKEKKESIIITPISKVESEDDISVIEYQKFATGEKRLTDVNGLEKQVKKVLGENSDVDSLYIRDYFNLTLNSEKNELLKEKGITIDLTFESGVGKKEKVFAIYLHDDKWKCIDSVKNNGDGTVTATFEELSTVAFLVAEETIDVVEREELQIREYHTEIEIWSMVAVISFGLIVVLLCLRFGDANQRLQALLVRKVFTVALLICALIFVLGEVQMDRYKKLQKEADGMKGLKLISVEGQKYLEREDVTTILLMGINQPGTVEGSEFYRNEGTADIIMLLAFDEKEKNYSIIQIDRNTMVDMNVLGISGNISGTTHGQIALTHTYGTGLEDSCENVRQTVSYMFDGMPIDYYAAINLEALKKMTEMVSGVTVDVKEDFSVFNASLVKGELLLNGEQSVSYVSVYGDGKLSLAKTHMMRQKEYAEKFIEALNAKLRPYPDYVIQMYDEIYDYMVTDISTENLYELSEKYSEYELKEIVSLEGKIKDGTRYIEFHPDKEKLEKLSLKMFYKKK